MHPAANEESASPAYAPPSGDLPSHHAQTGKGQRYLFVPATLAGKARLGGRRHERHHRQERTAAPGGERYEHDPLGEVRNFASIRPHIQPTPEPPDYRSTHLRKPLLAGYAAARSTFAFVRGRRGSLTKLCFAGSVRAELGHGELNATRTTRSDSCYCHSGLLTQIPRSRFRTARSGALHLKEAVNGHHHA
jgi:hypothetical protein